MTIGKLTTIIINLIKNKTLPQSEKCKNALILGSKWRRITVLSRAITELYILFTYLLFIRLLTGDVMVLLAINLIERGGSVGLIRRRRFNTKSTEIDAWCWSVLVLCNPKAQRVSPLHFPLNVYDESATKERKKDKVSKVKIKKISKVS